MKVNKQHIKKAVFIYEDPDTGEDRRVVFGEMSEVLSLLTRQIPLVVNQIEKFTKKEFKTPMEMILYYMTHKEIWIKLNGIEASDDMELELTYETKKV
jgi:hypothetical protein